MTEIRKRYENRWKIGYGGGKIYGSEEILFCIIMKLVKSFINAKSMIIDIGCGSGEILSRLGVQSQSVGVDISKNALTIVQRHKESLLGLILADASALPIRNGVIDFIISKELIEHLEKPEKFIKQVKLALKKESHALFIVPNVCKLRYRTHMLLGLGFFDMKEYIWHFTAKSFRDMIEKNGLKVDHIRGDQVIFPLLWRITHRALRILIARIRPSFAEHIICVCKKI